MNGPRDFSAVLGAAGEREFQAAGKYLHVMAAPSGSVFISLDGGSELERVGGEGIYIGAGFRKFRVRSPNAQSVRFMVADEPQVTGGGNVGSGAPAGNIVEVPSAAIATPAADAILNAAALAVGANAARRRISVCSLSANTGSVFVQATGAGAGVGIELQPGQTIELKTTAAFDVRNDSGATQTVMRFEET